MRYPWLLCAIALFPLQAIAETITITADPWCPYTCDPKSERPGYMIELIQKAFAKHDIKVRYVITPWTSAVKRTRRREFNGIVGAAHGDAPDFVFPKISQGKMLNVFYVKQGDEWRYDGLASLEARTLGIVSDYSYGKTINAYIERYREDTSKLQVVSGDEPVQGNVENLIDGRIDVMLEADAVMKYYLAKAGLDASIQPAGALPANDDDDQLYIAFSPGDVRSSKYADILSQETQAMRESGELQAILNKYKLKDWMKP
jgi:polar amino acid transport system substrate-binding protein